MNGKKEKLHDVALVEDTSPVRFELDIEDLLDAEYEIKSDISVTVDSIGRNTYRVLMIRRNT